MAASPTLRRRRLARQLLKLRADKGLTVGAVGAEAKRRSPSRPWSAAKVTRIENRQLQHLRETDLLTLLDIYGVTDADERAAYVRLAREASQTGWWVGYRDVVGSGTYIDLETGASELRAFEIVFIPGLLQTPAYAGAVAAASGVTSEHEIDRRVEARMMRRQVLDQPDAPTLDAVIDEAALHKIPEHMRAEQVQHLIDMQSRPNVSVRILPNSTGLHAGMEGAFVLMSFPHDPPVVYLEQSLAGMFLEEADELAHYERVWAHVQESALSADDSVAFLRGLTGSQ
ncbi:helix-turn-helix domain-containing protein [Nocardiopsis trehalosi]|uniref:helix-turn-helix domain-containing protein n=1 Tax=Nocardiopsis trehalosi TaxID=109329 RepID=UPI000831ECA5|nr:helix-turn-helix transcriptional regulator [Nocardiopsis trehalosi]